MVSLLAMAVGFFGGVMFGVFKSDSPIPGQSAVPVQSSSVPQSGADLSNMIAALEREVAANPANVNAWINLGNNYFDTNKYEKSIQVMYRRAGKPQEAIKAFDKAAEVDPKHETSRFNKGIVLMHDLQDIQGAIEAWEGLLQINPIAMAPNGQSIDQMIVGLKQQAGQQAK